MRDMDKRKLLCVGAAILVCTTVIGGKVCAAEVKRRDGIDSRGIINYDDGKVVIDSADLVALADEMDDLELSFKVGIADALAKIRTYIQPDGSISHDVKADIDPQQIVFGSLTDAILQTQSVSHLANTQASDESGLIYYKFAKNNILEVTGEDTGMPVFIVPATEDNLTAQTAGWVDGQCLAGNGSDNYYFYQKGFIEGYAKKIGAVVEYQYDDSGKIESAKLVFS